MLPIEAVVPRVHVIHLPAVNDVWNWITEPSSLSSR